MRDVGAVLAATGRAGGRWIREAVAAAPPPRVPWAGPWKCTLAGILVRNAGSPLLAIRPLTLLDRFGALHLDTEQAGFDGARHDWRKISELRVRDAFELLTTDALEQEVDRIRTLFPPVPGRRKALTYLAQNLATVLLAALESPTAGTVVGDMRYRGLMPGRHVARPGLFAAAVLSLRPDIDAALREEAARHGVPVTGADTAGTSGSADRAARVAVLRRRTESLVARLSADETDDGAHDAEGVLTAHGEASGDAAREAVVDAQP